MNRNNTNHTPIHADEIVGVDGKNLKQNLEEKLGAITQEQFDEIFEDW